MTATAAAVGRAADGMVTVSSRVQAHAHYLSDQLQAIDRQLDEVEAAWHGPRARAVLTGAHSYLRGQRHGHEILVSVAGVIGKSAGRAMSVAEDLARAERLLASAKALQRAGDPDGGPAVAAAYDALATARHAWHQVQVSFSSELDTYTQALRTVAANAVELPDPTRYGTAAGAQPVGFGAASAVGAAPFGRAAPTAHPSAALHAAVVAGLRRITGLHAVVAAIRAATTAISATVTAALREQIDSPEALAAYLAGLPPDEAVALWNMLTVDDQRAVAELRPDWLVLTLVPAGGFVVADVARAAFWSNRYMLSSEQLGIEASAALNFRVVSIHVGAELTAIMRVHNTGEVDVLLTAGGRVGLGLDIGAGQGGQTSASLGATGGAIKMLRFDSEAEAAAAIATLREAIREGLFSSVDEVLVEARQPGGRRPFEPAVTEVFRAIDDHEWFTEIAKGFRSIWPSSWPFGPTPLSQRVDELFDSHGVSTTYSGGPYFAAGTQYDFSGLAAAHESGQVSVQAFTTTPANGSDDPAARGVIISADLSSAHYDGPLAYEARGSMIVEIYRQDGQQYGRITLDGSTAAGVTADVFAMAGAPTAILDAARPTALGGLGATVEITVALDDGLAEPLVEVVTAIVNGENAHDELMLIVERAEVNATVYELQSAATRTGVDVAVFEAEITTEHLQTTTLAAYRKHPGGTMYDLNEYNDAIDALTASAP